MDVPKQHPKEQSPWEKIGANLELYL